MCLFKVGGEGAVLVTVWLCLSLQYIQQLILTNQLIIITPSPLGWGGVLSFREGAVNFQNKGRREVQTCIYFDLFFPNFCGPRLCTAA